MDCLSLPGKESGSAYFRMIRTHDLRPNPWNPNRIPREKYRKLKNAIAEKGLLCPALVRPSPQRSGSGEIFEIIDGEHRFQIARSLGIDEMPCVVIDLPDNEAKIKTLQLNGLRGEDEPERLARLIADLNIDYDLDELEGMLPLDRYDLQNSLDLLALIDRKEPETSLEEEMEQMLERIIFSVVVTRKEKTVIESALLQCKKSKENIKLREESFMESNEITDGQILAEICGSYLETAK